MFALSVPISYVVWELWGYNDFGNVSLLAVYHYADHSHAESERSASSERYIIRSRRDYQPDRKN